MKFSSDWLVLTTTQTNVTNGLLVTSEGSEFLIVKDLSSSVQKKFSRGDLIGDYKYRGEILHILQKAINITECENKFVDQSAAKIIDEICETNRLLY